VREISQGFVLAKVWVNFLTVLNLIENPQIQQKAVILMTSCASAAQVDLSGTG
jgi:hypothetical protein